MRKRDGKRQLGHNFGDVFFITMGLFNRNKGDAPAPSTPEPGSALPDGAFDFDAISRDLDAQNGASSFDSLLAAPATQNPQTTVDDSVFDFPENDPLGLGTPATGATGAGTAPVPTSPEAVINAPMSPATSPTTGMAPLETAPVVPIPVPVPKAKKPLPIVPLLGALGLLAVAGGGAMFLLNSNQNSEPDVPAPPPTTAGRISSPASPNTPPATGSATAPVAPGIPVAPGSPATGLRSASPGIAPPVAPRQPLPVTRATSSGVSVIAGQSPAGKLPAATGGLDAQLASKLKALWQAGADAKHKGDYKTARAAWGEALRLRPSHPGFQDSINKLPR